MVKPIRILLLLFYVACITLVIMVLSPGEIRLSDTLSLNVFSLKDLQKEEQQKVDISEIEALQARLDSLSKVKETQLAADSAKQATSAPRQEKAEAIGPVKYGIQYADSTSPSLENFFQSLSNLSGAEELIRIVHYGDSQIEGDRISEYLRSRLQSRFGGCGVGLVPLIEKQASRSTLITDFAGNWNKVSINHNAPARPRPYGLLGAYYKFTSRSDSGQSSKVYRSWVRFKESALGNKDRSTHIENIKILCATPNTQLSASIKIDDTLISNELESDEKLLLYEQAVKARFKKVSINFESNGNPEFYGVAFDCNTGIAVDNVALRGSSGVEFTKMDKEFLRYQVEKMNVKLLILQFGVNVVPSVLKDYSFYEQMFYKQLVFLKSLHPKLDILVVGVSDMSRRQGTGYSSYPNIPKIRDAQRRAAFRAGCAFWDLYQAMGGENSMLSWVNARPPLAGRDFTHFNPRGARVVGEMLYNAIIKEYENYKKRNE